MRTLVQNIQEELDGLISLKYDAEIVTPSDFSLASLNEHQLAQLASFLDVLDQKSSNLNGD